jgi:hypothetical protein
MRLSRTGWIGFVLVAASAVTFTCWMMWFRTRTWQPVNMPISLSRGSHFSTGEFAVNLTAQYAIDISAKGKMSEDELSCLLGNGMRSTCHVPAVVEIHWTLLNDGDVVQGISNDSRGGGSVGSTGEAFRTIGFFKGEKNRRYRLDIDVLADGSKLAATDPHLGVSVFDAKYESGLVFSGLLRLGCVVLGIVGAGLLAGSIFVQRRN